MSSCPACSTENPEVAKFCVQCGAPLAAACPSCGAIGPPGARFCMECGSALGTTTEGPSSPAVVPAGGERKQITVLFADVAGSMDLQEQLDAEVWAEIMGRFVQVLAEGVRKFGGTVDKFTGDGIMAPRRRDRASGGTAALHRQIGATGHARRLEAEFSTRTSP